MEEQELFNRVAHSFEKQNFLTLIGAKLESVVPQKVTISCESKTSLHQQQGLLHGGIITSLADVACGYAALTTMPESAEVLTVELKINLMRPAAAKRVIATGQVLKAGRTLVVAEATVTGDDGTLIAKMLSTMIAVKGEQRTQRDKQ